MKVLTGLFIFSLIINYSCKPGTNPHETNAKDSLSSNKPDTGIEKTEFSSTLTEQKMLVMQKVNGKSLFDRFYKSEGKDYSLVLSLSEQYQKEFGAIYLNHWEWNQENIVRQWTYADSISCGEADVVVNYDLDSIPLVDIDMDGRTEMLIIYTLSCTYDVSPQTRYLVVIDEEGKTKIKLKGWSGEPGSKVDFSTIDLKKPTDESLSNEGKIENSEVLESLTPASRKKIIRFWELAFDKDRQRELIQHNPRQD